MTSEKAEAPSLLRETREGFGAAFMNPDISLLIGLSAAQMFVAGALVVLEVVIALELLGKGDAWVGILSAAFGVGGALGVLAAGARVGHANLAVDFGVGMILWGIPLIAIGIWPDPMVAVAMMTIMGFGNTLVDVSGLTLLQRIVPDEVIARVFGVMETTVLLSVSLGAAIAPALVKFAGADTSLVLTGLFLPVVMILAWRRFNLLSASAHAPERELALLAGISFFEPLPRPVLEHLARRLGSFRMPAGARVFEQGDRGDRFYVVATGLVDILKDSRQVAQIGPGGYFGEIALLSDVPRQASARIHSDCELLTLEGEEFVAAVTGHARSKDTAHAVIQSYSTGIPLGGLRAGT
ncbi:MAG: cyclic nucleotide-binding domain-containing protein [Gammaproteobacteria bacterium]